MLIKQLFRNLIIINFTINYLSAGDKKKLKVRFITAIETT